MQPHNLHSFVALVCQILVEYTDGFRATILFIDGFASSWAYAARVVDADAPATHAAPSRIEACEFFLQPGGIECHQPFRQPMTMLHRLSLLLVRCKLV